MVVMMMVMMTMMLILLPFLWQIAQPLFVRR
jgi:hypothetical protein